MSRSSLLLPLLALALIPTTEAKPPAGTEAKPPAGYTYAAFGLAEGSANNAKFAEKLAKSLDHHVKSDHPSVTRVEFEATGKIIPAIYWDATATATITCNGESHTVRAESPGIAWVGTWGELASRMAKRPLRAAPC